MTDSLGSNFIILVWCLAQLGLSIFLVRMCEKFLKVFPSLLAIKTPHKAIHLILTLALTSTGTVLLLENLLPTDYFYRSPFWSTLNIKTLSLSIVLGFCPLLFPLILHKFVYKSKVEFRPKEMSFPLIPFISLLIICLLNGYIEELIYRSTPLSLVSNKELSAAFIIPTLVFVIIHFLESYREINLWRIAELLAASLFYFLVAYYLGIWEAVLVHTFSNFSIFMTSGDWSIGAFCNVNWKEGNKKLIADTFGHVISAILFIIILFYYK